ncbi:restriction endonuclease subunit S [Lacticaseibacillus parahuelsenbergensis]|uniref:Restriction endonuclease subunit S n=1 Tax=Lacticaseibacillus parahuelsenbergensis TaxID=3068305 RepID=A0ABY9L0H1_9LACO|nr:restriction endonuclease subunit S [Lacticaseibacillus sp. NCIMB 15471]WLV77184.1 restriction endonuclease subunit S [Lacticaseibacillus sp. NCIMB 15471]
MNAWEKRKLGDLSTIRRGASPRPISSPKWFSGTSSVGWLRISDVTEQNGRVYSVAQHLSEKGQKKTLVLTKRHLILSIAATVGKPVQNYTALGIHDGFIVFMNPKFDLDFMFYFLEKYQPQWMRFGQPGSQVNLNSELVRNLEIRLPRRDEQEQVSKILLKLDNLIAATQGKLDQLQMVKKALLQHLFDQSMRFKGYSDPWEKRKFKDIVTRVNQMSNDSKLPSVEFEDIVSGQGRLRKSAHLKFNTKKGISFQPRDVLFGKLRPYLHNWLFPNFHGRAVGDFWVLRANSNVFPGYLFQLVQAPRFQSIANISSGTKMPRSDWKTVAESHFLLPDVSEQKRIWQLFKVLDDLIAATQSKLSSLESLKKALLQGLFI